MSFPPFGFYFRLLLALPGRPGSFPGTGPKDPQACMFINFRSIAQNKPLGKRLIASSCLFFQLYYPTYFPTTRSSSYRLYRLSAKLSQISLCHLQGYVQLSLQPPQDIIIGQSKLMAGLDDLFRPTFYTTF